MKKLYTLIALTSLFFVQSCDKFQHIVDPFIGETPGECHPEDL